MPRLHDDPPPDDGPEPDREDSEDFETSLGQIEQIVMGLEGGQLSLDDSLKAYETAVAKMRRCYQMLEVAQRRISVLSGVDADGNPIVEPLRDDQADGGDDSNK